MSVQRRKIGYFSIDFEDNEGRKFDRELLKKLLNYVNNLSGEKRIIADSKTNKAMDIEKINIYKKEGVEFAKIVFKSCKFNHSPNYMSSVDGSERPTDKKLSEGEKELTHMCMRLDDKEAYTIFEERRVGVGMRHVIRFFNKNLDKLREKEGIEGNEMISFGYIPSDNFLESIDKSERIVTAELYTDRKVVGSEGLELMEISDEMREDVTITIKAEPRKSLKKEGFKAVFNKLFTSGSKVSRIRLYAKDKNNMDMLIDTYCPKKIKEINVELKEDGTVDTYSIFKRMEKILGENK